MSAVNAAAEGVASLPTVPNDMNPSTMAFEWLEAPGVNSVHLGIWTVLLEREVMAAVKTTGSGGHNIDWKGIVRTRETVEIPYNLNF
ncbi:uncharacterized protein PHACADRAFT_212002 [Phanerochaete carnosa HHB-10118-sp]|uniref:Uncharacterized protein n=1 Tax=Phanerochaete carnosa (strain HHB-10118-sp) TaxID=650164 RepID=K5W139_PHACS|nr:uncharacterized protein PHACADRAFT_212002 [Phanerochaete carnosa HHB-10118-sp]EKM52790.1 hypothetical protein PHACADRAFT_212002 [Phanerochaete carnosa HHB-10118-sp]